MMRSPLAAVLLAASLLAPGPAGADDDFEKILKSGDVAQRLDAVSRIVEKMPDGTVDLLLQALDDRDGEVVERACAGLAKVGSPKAARPLAEMALTGLMRRLRLSAAAALGSCAPEEGTKFVLVGLRAKDQVAVYAAEALGEIRHPSAKDKLLEALRSREPELRRAAAESLGSFRDPSILKDLDPLFADPTFEVRAGVVEGMARVGSFDAIPMLLSRLQDPDLADLVERRVVSALRRILWARRDDPDLPRAQRKIEDAYRNEKGGVASARLARVLGSLGRKVLPPPVVPDPRKAGADGGVDGATPREAWAPPDLEGSGPVGDPLPLVKALGEVGVPHVEKIARRAAVAALGRIGGDEALQHLLKAIIEDKDELVRFHALRGYMIWKNPKEDDAAFQTLSKVLEYDKSALVREEAAVRLGVKELAKSVDVLTPRLQDSAWEVSVASAVSMGKTRDPRVVEILRPLLEHRDWRIRGGAVAGLGWSRQAEAIPILIGALADKEVSVGRTAWEFLKRLVGTDRPFKQKDWADWWAEHGKGFVVADREAEIRDALKYGYALKDRDVYEDLDVMVLRSRGDSIQDLLAVLEIKFRLTQAKSIRKDGVQPFGVFVANCTGEVQDEDHERIQWFVHAGGALFGSCWAIDKTIGEEFPNTIRKFPGAKGQVLDQVFVEQMPTDTHYLDGVFPGVTRPIYQLYGAFLIEVLDPERCEVLIDSPDCATRWNGGNLAAWFTSGHGVVMGSSNHFDRQTMSKLQNARGVSVRTEAERRAFAVNHFGFSWERVRDLDARGVFARQSEAEKEVTDLSAFRFVTNFVRRKRIIDL